MSTTRNVELTLGHASANWSVFQILITSLCVLGLAITFAQPSMAQDPIEDIIINEIFYSGGIGEDWVEIKNTGTVTQNVLSWWLCTRITYARLSSLTVVSGPVDGNLDPGEIMVVQISDDGGGGIDQLNNESADLGLYSDSNFVTPIFMADFLQYNTMENVGRSDIAAQKGIWLRLQDGPPALYDTTLPAAPGESLSYCGDGELLSLGSEYQSTTPTPGIENTPCVTIFSDGFESGDLTNWSSTNP